MRGSSLLSAGLAGGAAAIGYWLYIGAVLTDSRSPVPSRHPDGQYSAFVLRAAPNGGAWLAEDEDASERRAAAAESRAEASPLTTGALPSRPKLAVSSAPPRRAEVPASPDGSAPSHSARAGFARLDIPLPVQKADFAGQAGARSVASPRGLAHVPLPDRSPGRRDPAWSGQDRAEVAAVAPLLRPVTSAARSDADDFPAPVARPSGADRRVADDDADRALPFRTASIDAASRAALLKPSRRDARTTAARDAKVAARAKRPAGRSARRGRAPAVAAWVRYCTGAWCGPIATVSRQRGAGGWRAYQTRRNRIIAEAIRTQRRLRIAGY
ncbi:MAG: hypothetical protein NW205_01580 [Hyphomicrobiaceae bacterium]|nr:hypothetical protein [Hyphomicrobiaceae bacterium]